MESIENARFLARAGMLHGFGKTPEEALAALMEYLDGELLAAIVILPVSRGDIFFSDAQQQRLQDLKGRLETLTAHERAALEELIAASFDATIARTSSFPRLK